MTAGAFVLLAATIIATHPATNNGGKVMTVEESYTAAVRPNNVKLYWTADGQVSEKRPQVKELTWALPTPENDQISYGTSVSRNEFGIDGGIFPSPSGEFAAIYRKDESRVTDFPLLDINSRTGSLKSIKYPMNGMDSELISLCVCDKGGNILTTLKVTDFDEERYLTNVRWSPDDKYIFVHVVDRAQHHMNLNMYRASDGEFVRTILSEENEAWIEPEDPVDFIKGTYRFIYRTDNRDGYRNLYLCDTLGTVRRITEVDADVSYVGNDGKWLYYTSAEVSPIENHLFRVEIGKAAASKSIAKAKLQKPQRLTPDEGWHNITMSPDYTKFIDTYSSFNVPGVTDVRNADGSLVERRSVSSDPLANFLSCEVELGTVKSADGKFDNYYRLFKPANFDPNKKYPLIVYVYGGPHSQMVTDSWLGSIRLWEYEMAQRGYVVYVQDNRGTSNRGAEFEKAINRECGQAEMADQMAGLNDLLDRSPWIDRDRIGVHGWSYGGFMTISLFTNYPEVFKVAVAGGPVIDWKWYEIMYGERYMDNTHTNPEGFEKTSLLNKTDKVHGKLLICQGAIDATVVWEHSLSFTQKCIIEGKQLDYFPYPCDEHNMRGKAAQHLYHKITDYFTSWL